MVGTFNEEQCKEDPKVRFTFTWLEHSIDTLENMVMQLLTTTDEERYVPRTIEQYDNSIQIDLNPQS
jgi:hypothetical protein